MLEPKSVMVNGRDYTVNPFNPEDAYKFFHERLNALAFGKSLEPLGRKALNQCLNEMGRQLSNPDEFQKTFSEHPEDMMELEQKATEALTAPFEKQSGAMS